MTTDYRVEIERPDATIVHHSRGSLACDAHDFIVGMQLTLMEDGTTVFEREWSERIPRDML